MYSGTDGEKEEKDERDTCVRVARWTTRRSNVTHAHTHMASTGSHKKGERAGENARHEEKKRSTFCGARKERETPVTANEGTRDGKDRGK